MINKIKLQSFIQKYHLGGINNQVKWIIKDNKLSVYAGDSMKVCKVEFNEFDFEDCNLGIFDTSKLLKLISITSGELMFDVEKYHTIPIKLNISDSFYDLVFTLADILVIKKVKYYEDEGDWDAEIPLNPEHVLNLIKAKNALGDMNKLIVKTELNLDKEPICVIMFGDETGFSNKVSYQLQGNIKDANINLPFNSDIFRDILNTNKDMDSGVLKINKRGMIKLNFTSQSITSEYFLLRNE